MQLKKAMEGYSLLGPEWNLSIRPAKDGWALVPFRETKKSRRIQYGEVLAVFAGRNFAKAVRDRLVAQHIA